MLSSILTAVLNVLGVSKLIERYFQRREDIKVGVDKQKTVDTQEAICELKKMLDARRAINPNDGLRDDPNNRAK